MTRKAKKSEEAILAKELALASGTLLVDGEPIHMMTEAEAAHVFGETESHVIISTPPPRRRGSGRRYCRRALHCGSSA
jgi:hypothetical protein